MGKRAAKPLSKTQVPKYKACMASTDVMMTEATEVPTRIKSPMEPTSAASTIIQRYWRRKFKYNTTWRFSEEFFATGPTIEHVKSIRYDF